MDRVRLEIVAALLAFVAFEAARPVFAQAPEPSRIAVISDRVGALAYSPDGVWLAAGCADKQIRLWDLRTNKLALTIKGPRGSVRRVAFTADGESLFASSMDRKVYAFRPSTGELLRSWDSGVSFLSSMAVPPDAKSVWVGGLFVDRATEERTEQVTQRDSVTGSLLRELPRGKGSLAGLALSADGRSVATAVLKDTPNDSVVQVHEAGSGELRFSTADEAPFSLAWSPDARVLATGTLKSVPGEGGDPRQVGVVHLRDGATGKVQKTFENAESHGPVGAIAFSPDGQRLASVARGPIRETRDGDVVTMKIVPAIAVWDTTTGKLVSSYEGELGGTDGLVFSPDGKTLAFADGYSLRLIDVATGKWREELMRFTTRYPEPGETP